MASTKQYNLSHTVQYSLTNTVQSYIQYILVYTLQWIRDNQMILVTFVIREPFKKNPGISDLVRKGGGLAQSETLILIWSVKTQC